MPFPGHHPGKAQPRAVGHFVCQLARSLAGKHPGSLHTGIDFDHRARTGAEPQGGLVQLANIFDRIDRHTDICLRRQRGHPARLDRPHHLIRHQDVTDTVGGHHFGFAQFGAGNTDGPRLELQMRDRGALVRFRMGTPVGTARFHIGRHGFDIRFQRIEIDQHRRGIDFFDRQANQRRQHGFRALLRTMSLQTMTSGYRSRC